RERRRAQDPLQAPGCARRPGLDLTDTTRLWDNRALRWSGRARLRPSRPWGGRGSVRASRDLALALWTLATPARTEPRPPGATPRVRSPGVERQPVDSSLIRSVGYDLPSSILEIELVEPNRVYEFFDVPFSVYTELMEAESKGSYFNEFIRDLYAYQ